MISALTVRGVTLAQGTRPKVIVPVLAPSFAECEAQAAALRSQPAADLVELRLDGIADLSADALPQALRRFRAALGEEKPLLATIRTQREGGLMPLSPTEYSTLAKALCQPGVVDLLDIELSAGSACCAELLAAAHEAGLAAVFSCHHFEGTPSLAEMTDTLCAMGKAGADICKLAVMPHSAADAALLLQATAQAAQAMPGQPLITMSMGALGAVTRVCGGRFGSVATFGTAGVSSAPGQPDAASLQGALAALESCLD